MNLENADSIDHPDDDRLELYLLGSLSLAEMDAFDRHLADCNECKVRLTAAARFVGFIFAVQRSGRGADRRSAPRFHASDTGVLRCLSPLLDQRLPVKVTDVSKSGLGLLVPMRLEPGSLVQVRFNEAVVLAQVVYSREVSEHEFHTGLQLEDVFRFKT